jgi:hypothetical protein
MNIQNRNANFLSLTAKLLKPAPRAVAEEMGCPNLVEGCCDAVGHPRSPSECYCKKAAEACLKVEAGE